MSAGTFVIVVNGTLSPAFTAVFEDFTVATTPEGLTQLTGWVPDQARLHGALGMLRDLGIELVSVTTVSSPGDSDPARYTKEPS